MLSQCKVCHGFLPPMAAICPHCEPTRIAETKKATSGWNLKKVLLAAASGGVVMTTLMACYGDTYNGECGYGGTDCVCYEADDHDCDGVQSWDDCDDNDPNIGSSNNDRDCDGVPNEDDCDNGDNTCLCGDDSDVDCDGVSVQHDCNDNDPNIGSSNNDSDCDGVLSDDDCNDNDPALGSQLNDLDCDGVLSDNDCDDSDPNIGSDCTLPDCLDSCTTRESTDACAPRLTDSDISCEELCATLDTFWGTDVPSQRALLECLNNALLCDETLITCAFPELAQDSIVLHATVYGTGFEDSVPDGAPVGIVLDTSMPLATFGTVQSGVIDVSTQYQGRADTAPTIHWFIDTDSDQACTDGVDLAGVGTAVPAWTLPDATFPNWEQPQFRFVLPITPADAAGCDTLMAPDPCMSDADCEEGTCQEGVCTLVSMECPEPCEEGQMCVEGACVDINPVECVCDADCTTGETCSESGVCEGGSPLGDICLFNNQCGSDGICLDQSCTAACDDDAQCLRTQACIEGLCQESQSGEACTFNADCGEGVCINAHCFERCCDNTECEESFICNQGVCLPNDLPSPQCTQSSACENGATCVNAVCRNACNADMECATSEVCDTGFCTPTHEQNPECQRSTDCEESQVCTDGLCQ